MEQSPTEIEYKQIQSKLKGMVKVMPWEIDFFDAFNLTFARAFVADTPNYKLQDGTVGAIRSGWTYHTAFAIAQTCKMFNLLCKFESHGKRDAVIETNDEEPEILLFAEWEWDYEDVFGKGKELEKLKASCRATKTANAFLLVYCPNHTYADYISRIAAYWVKAFSKTKNPPSLYVNTIIFEQAGNIREFERLNTVYIDPMQVWILNALDFRE